MMNQILAFLFLFSTTSNAAIEFAGDFVLDKTFSKSKQKVGGLSGLYFDKKTNELFSVSDDSMRASPRFYKLGFELAELKLKVQKEFTLKKRDGKPYPAGRADTEAITRFNDGRFLISSEGVPRRKIDPKIFVLSSAGQVQDEILLPKLFLPRDGSGIRENKALESLTLSPKKDRLYAATEDNLLQDTAEVNGGYISRIIEWQLEEKTFRPTTQIIYPLRKHSDEEFEVGLTELVSTGHRKFLSLERGFAPPNTITGMVYEVDCQNATDVSGEFAIKSIDFKICSKNLLINLNDYANEFKKHRIVDNVEAMTIIHKNQITYILIASDDNFRSQQVNQFLLFKWSNKPNQKKVQ